MKGKGKACPPGQGGKMMGQPMEMTAGQRKKGKSAGKKGKK